MYKQKILSWVKQEVLLIIAVLLAVLSMFLVKPDRLYAGYIDTHTIGLLFCLMAVMAGLERVGFFKAVGEFMLSKVKNKRGLEAVLIFLCFFSSMLITNDVALITFVPLSLQVLKMAGLKNEIIPVVVMQTIAANLGSMLTPIGNPQNLYIYQNSHMSIFGFISTILPYAVISFVFISAFIVLRKDFVLNANIDIKPDSIKDKKLTLMYFAVFALCILTVSKVLPLGVLVVLVLAFLFVADRKTILSIDYTLLLTFIGFFIFVGNMARIPVFYNAVESLLNKNDFLTILGASQIISNVPATLLLSGFTDKWNVLLIASNIGGLGTLIASMASLISYKYIAKEIPHKTNRYIIYFTIVNIMFLAANLIFYFIIN